MGCRVGGHGFGPHIGIFFPPFSLSFPSFSLFLSLFSFSFLFSLSSLRHFNAQAFSSIICRPVAGGGGVGGVPTPPSEINDIHSTNYLIQERPFDCF